MPIGLIGLALVSRFLPAGERQTPRPVDFVGFLLSAAAFSGFVFGISVLSLPALPLAYGYTTIAGGLLAGGLYLVHARRVPYPLLDPAMMRYPLFRAGIIGGSMFRLGLGAIPFLLPLMLQLGFGLTPLRSGLITFVSAVGAIASKFVAQRVYRAFGFRTVLAAGAFVSSLLVGLNALFTPATPAAVIMTALLLGGVLRSIGFTGLNAMIFSEVDAADSSQATAINAVVQQISLASGVALAGGILDLAGRMHGGGLELRDFHIAFVVVACISAVATIFFLRLPGDAGAAVSGHRSPA